MEPRTMLGFALIVVGLALVACGVLVLIPRETEVVTAVERGNPVPPSPRSVPPPLPKIDPQSPKEKGSAFEGWVVKKFDERYFDLKDWRGDKYVEGRFAESSEHPDLEIEFHLRDVRARFAVECKWRKSFEQRDKPGITWASERQIDNYQRFSKDRGMPVFVIIGIGGEPNAPAELYVVPLNGLRYPWASVEYLAKFRRAKVDADFFYEYQKPALR